jgi:hypothetical protein
MVLVFGPEVEHIFIFALFHLIQIETYNANSKSSSLKNCLNTYKSIHFPMQGNVFSYFFYSWFFLDLHMFGVQKLGIAHCVDCQQNKYKQH